jgi:hypothetical protein
LSRRSGDDVDYGHRATLLWKDKGRPVAFVPAEPHVDALDLTPRQSFFDVQVKSDERERDPERLRAFISVLRRERIDHVLMDECRVAMRERIALQLIVRVLL